MPTAQIQGFISCEEKPPVGVCNGRGQPNCRMQDWRLRAFVHQPNTRIYRFLSGAKLFYTSVPQAFLLAATFLYASYLSDLSIVLILKAVEFVQRSSGLHSFFAEGIENMDKGLLGCTDNRQA